MVVARGVARDEVDPLISIEISPIEVIEMESEQLVRRSYWGGFERLALIIAGQLLLMLLAVVASEVFSDADPAVVESLQILFGLCTLVFAYLLLVAFVDLLSPLWNSISRIHSGRLATGIERVFWTICTTVMGYVTYRSAAPSEYQIEGAWIFEAVVGVGFTCICLSHAMPGGILASVVGRLRDGGEPNA